jgi:hypothetical protein
MRPATPPAREPERTASGLTRRVPGAHLPTSGPVIIRRDDERSAADVPPPPDLRPQGPPPGVLPPPIGPGPGAAPRADGPAPGQERAESVYTLLTSFADGVQRGLDEASTTQQGRPDDT